MRRALLQEEDTGAVTSVMKTSNFEEEIMETAKTLCVAALMFGLSIGATAEAAGQAPARSPPKNWTAPNYKIHGQKLCDEIVAKHPELIRVTLHGGPPAMEMVYTIVAGTFSYRV